MYILLLVLVILLILSFFLFQKDFFSPSFIVFSGYLVSLIFGIFNQDSWDISISSTLIGIMIAGWISFFIGEFLVRHLFFHQRNTKYNVKKTYPLKLLKCNKFIFWSLIAINIIITIFLWREIVNIANSNNDSYSNAIASFKDSDVGLSTLMIQLIKITKGTAFVFLLFFVNNLIYKIKNKQKYLKEFIYLIPGIIYCIQCLIKGGRYNVIAYILALLFLIYLFVQTYYNWKFKFKFKHLMITILLICFIFYSFWAIKNFVGRDSNDTLLDYLSRYIGGSYKLFDLYLENPPKQYSINTFSGIIESFNKLFGSSISYTSYHEFRFSETGILIGNVYTALRNYYNDFGILGVVTLSLLKSIIFSFIYLKLVTKNIYRNKFLLILYSSLIFTLFFEFFVDYFYARISLGYIVEVIIMYFIYICAIKITPSYITRTNRMAVSINEK